MSTDSYRPSSGLSSTQANLLRMNAAIAHALPHPDEEWTKYDVPEMVAKVRRKLENFDVITIAIHGKNTRDGRNRYRTRHKVYEYVQNDLDKPRTLPCGHPGFRNLRGGEYGCQEDTCDAEFDRETVEEVLWS
jgi:hypothetical protein